jgi:hypothetical protein
MTIKWLTTDQVARNGVKILGYGVGGVGKTTLIATAPAPFVISAEAGLLSLARHKIPGAAVSSLAELGEVWRWVTEANEAKQFATICVDSSTEIAEVLLQTLKASNKDPRKAYGELLDQLMAILRGFRDIVGKHVYITAKEEWAKDEASGAMRFQPMMPGQKLGQQLPYLFDEVFRLIVARDQQGKKQHVICTQADYQYEGKDRSGCLAPFEKPDLTAIINKITGGTK